MKKFRYYNITILLVTLLAFFIPFQGHLIVAQIGLYLLILSVIYAVMVLLIRLSHKGALDPFIAIIITLLIGAGILWLALVN